MEATIIAAIITGGFELLRQHLNKPPGWKPTTQDVEDFLAVVQAASPEAIKAAAAKRLGVTWPRIEDPLPPNIPEM